jgi:hypothetical protein
METTLTFPQEDSCPGNGTICWHKGRPKVQRYNNAPTSPNYWPFRQHLRVDAVSPEVAMGGLQDKDIYNQEDINWIQHKINTTIIYHLLAQIYSAELSIKSNTIMQLTV